MLDSLPIDVIRLICFGADSMQYADVATVALACAALNRAARCAHFRAVWRASIELAATRLVALPLIAWWSYRAPLVCVVVQRYLSSFGSPTPARGVRLLFVFVSVSGACQDRRVDRAATALRMTRRWARRSRRGYSRTIQMSAAPLLYDLVVAAISLGVDQIRAARRARHLRSITSIDAAVAIP